MRIIRNSSRLHFSPSTEDVESCSVLNLIAGIFIFNINRYKTVSICKNSFFMHDLFINYIHARDISITEAHQKWLKQNVLRVVSHHRRFYFVTGDSRKKKLSGYLPLTFYPAINFFLPCSRGIILLPLLLLFPILRRRCSFPSSHIYTYTGSFIKSGERPRNLYRFVSRCVHDVPFVLPWNSRCPPRITWRDHDG